MKALDRAIAALRSAHARDPLAVTPGHVLSPMDAQRTVTVRRDLIEACDRAVRAGQPLAGRLSTDVRSG